MAVFTPSPKQEQNIKPERVIQEEETNSKCSHKHLQKADKSSVVTHAEIISTSEVLCF